MTDTEYRKMIAVRVGYEWDWEELDEYGDIAEHWHSDEPQAKPFSGRGAMCLVRNEGSDADGLSDRQWAYIDDNGNLPERFQTASGGDGAKVPKSQRRAYDAWRTRA